MGYTCSTCGQVLQSEGSLGLHELTGHDRAPVAAPSGAPPTMGTTAMAGPGSLGSVGLETGGAPRRSAPSPFRVLGVVVGAAVLGVGASLVGLGVLKSTPGDVPAAAVTAAGQSGAVAPPAGYRIVTDAADRFSIAVPADWQDVPAADLSAPAAVLRRSHPRVAELLGDDGVPEHARLLAMNLTSGSSELVQMIPAPGATLASLPTGAFSEEYRKNGGRSIQEDRVSTPAGEAIRVSVVIEQRGISVPLVQYVIVHDGIAWAVTYANPASTTLAADAAKIVATLRFL